jgi:hypothetical protein
VRTSGLPPSAGGTSPRLRAARQRSLLRSQDISEDSLLAELAARIYSVNG